MKWPNDLRIGGRKVGGVLVESSLDGSRVSHAVIGIGINVALDPSHNDTIASTATSLNLECGAPVSREVLLRHLLQEMDQLYQSLSMGSTPWTEWRSLLETLGKQVTVQELTASGDPGNCYSGLAEDVDPAGNLLLRMSGGQVVVLAGGEVTVQEEPASASTHPVQPRR